LYRLEKKYNKAGNTIKTGMKISKFNEGSEISLKIEGV
jgi:hypothetical protein